MPTTKIEISLDFTVIIWDQQLVVSIALFGAVRTGTPKKAAQLQNFPKEVALTNSLPSMPKRLEFWAEMRFVKGTPPDSTSSKSASSMVRFSSPPRALMAAHHDFPKPPIITLGYSGQ
ncbi:hypothetical protein TNIN_263431 [Trichonephila inaurata madagascariensis]|uniref:Uncharacterized protein n=1 Tax=Trichonephila inaurata madagascariensis TaxID=2747483 RepID=A0A8X6XXP4_9ARAC|nr:hypothetical protein TNIN_263431 [Trichonephila inaurata madagascariensis]